jgi:hypothetical protein
MEVNSSNPFSRSAVRVRRQLRHTEVAAPSARTQAFSVHYEKAPRYAPGSLRSPHGLVVIVCADAAAGVFFNCQA